MRTKKAQAPIMDRATADALHTAAFWASAPAYGTRAFWTLVLSQPGQLDAHGRDILIYGFGAAGPIRCTREYAAARKCRTRTPRTLPSLAA